MTNTIKVKIDLPYVAMPNETARDERLGIDTRGLLCLMMSMSDDWQFYRGDLMKRCKCGRGKYDRMIKELKDFGYLEIAPKLDRDKKLAGYEWIIRDGSEHGGRLTLPSINTQADKPDHIISKTDKKPKVKEKTISKDISKKHDEIGEVFNSMARGCDLPTIHGMNPRRTAAVKSRIKEYGEGVLFEVLDKVPRSDFLTGKTDPPFHATFDWIFKPANFIKILEGNYDNRKPKNDTGIINTNKSRPSLAKRESLDRAALAAIQSYEQG